MSSSRRVFIVMLVLAMVSPGASACSVHVQWYRYVNLVSLKGPKVAGLEWTRLGNILEYSGADRIVVSAVRGGQRSRIAKWDDGQECYYDQAGAERCHPNRPDEGLRLESLFGDWTWASDRPGALKRVYLPLIVETPDGEVKMALRSQAVRNTRKLHSQMTNRALYDICIKPELESE